MAIDIEKMPSEIIRNADLRREMREQLMSECTEEKLKAINAAIKTYREHSGQLYVDTVHWLEVLSSILDLVSKSNRIELIRESEVTNMVVGVAGVPMLDTEGANSISQRMDVLGNILNEGSYKYKVLFNILGCGYTKYIGKCVKMTITGRSKTEVLRGKLGIGSSRFDYLKIRPIKKDGTLSKSVRNLYLNPSDKVDIELDEDVESGV